MSHPFAVALLLVSAILTGCSQPEDPHADSIPPIPPGRAAATPGEDGAPSGGYQPPAPPPAP